MVAAVGGVIIAIVGMVVIMAMAIIVAVLFFLLLAFLLVLRVRVVRFLFLGTSLRSFFLLFLHPSDSFRPFIEPRAPVKGLAMNSGCASAL